MLPRPYQRAAGRLSVAGRFERTISRIKRFIGTGKRRAKVIGCTVLVVVLFVRIFTSRRVLRNLCYWWDPGSKGAKALTLGFGPPTYEKLKKWEDNLPQHNLDLPYPEGRTGRYVKFSNQIKKLGWNNVFNELCVFVPTPAVSSSQSWFSQFDERTSGSRIKSRVCFPGLCMEGRWKPFLVIHFIYSAQTVGLLRLVQI